MGPFRFSIPIGCQDSAEKINFATERELGIEVAAFATGPGVADLRARAKIERTLQRVLTDFPHARSYHGAFIDLNIHSEDPAIAAVASDRVQRDMDTAARLRCDTVVFHTGFNPLIPVTSYRESFFERHALFWNALADAWPGAKICLENLWEPSPEILVRLFRGIDHPRVGLCLDVAHAHVPWGNRGR